MKRLSAIFYMLFLSSCGLFLDKTIDQENLSNQISGNDDFMVDSLSAPQDSLLQTFKNFEYPSFSTDIFHPIPMQKISNENLIFFNIKSYVYSNKLDIASIRDDNFNIEILNDSISISSKLKINQLEILPLSVNGRKLDILIYSNFNESIENQKNLGIILKDNFSVEYDNLILDFGYLSAFSKNKNLRDNTTFILFDNLVLPKKYYHIFEDRIRVMLPSNMNNGLLRICSMDKDGALLRENHTIVSNGLPLLPEGNESSPYFSNRYYLTLDRFYDGNDENNIEIDPSIDDRVRYHGGDLVGLLSKIENGYFSRLGVKNLLISPIMKNPDSSYRANKLPYRKYMSFDGKHPISSQEIDYRYGDDDDFRKIVNASHHLGIRIFLDYLVGYTHSEHIYHKSYPEWYQSNEQSNFLPKLNFQNNEVIQKVTDDILYWIKEFNLDGIKYSAFNNIPIEFWSYLNSTLYSKNYNFENRLDGQFSIQTNLDLYNKGRVHFSGLNTNFNDLNFSIYQNLMDYNPINLFETPTGLDCEVRFISAADGESVFSDTLSSRLFIDSPGEIENAMSYEKLFMFHVMNNSLPGIPTIFYGDEYGQPGGGKFDSKRDMKFQNQLTILESHLKTRVSKLNLLRSTYPSLSLGDFFVLRESENYSVWLKSYYNEKILIFFNLQDKTIELNVPLPFKSKKLISLLDDQVIEVNDKNIIGLIVPPYKTGIFLLE